MTSRPGTTTSLRAVAQTSLFPLALTVSLACRASRATNTTPLEPVATPTEPAQRAPELESTPAWVGEALSWEKLKSIETWLATQPHDAPSFWRVEGELQLAQGRLEFARRDLGAKSADSTSATKRVRSSRAGLERVAADPSATDGQKKRANDLVARADKLLDGKSSTVAANAGVGVNVIPRAIWGAAAARPERMERTRGGYKKITVHHSAEENAPELDGSVADTAAALRQMQRSHMESKSPRWGDIGYHFLIDPAGHVFQGRELVWQGAHADGDNNIQNIGICMIGNFDEERPSKAALESLRKLIDGLRRTWSIPKTSVFGHQDLKSTRCPGKNLEPWVKSYAR